MTLLVRFSGGASRSRQPGH